MWKLDNSFVEFNFKSFKFMVSREGWVELNKEEVFGDKKDEN